MMSAGVILALASTSHAKSDRELISESRNTVAVFERTDPGMAALLERAPGYVVFPFVTKGAIDIGGANGVGVVFQKGKPIGKATLRQVGVVAKLDGPTYSQVILFETPAALANFVRGTFEFSRQFSAVALKSGASANAKYRDGAAVFTATNGGLMFEANVAGQKFGYEPFVVIQK
jgi:lipid-binding SYLF domain-containing protein